MTEKLCKQCGETKPLAMFHKNGKNRWKARCKECRQSGRGFVYTQISTEDQVSIVRRFDAGETIGQIARSMQRSPYTITLILRKVGRETARNQPPPSRDQYTNKGIGELPPDHPLYEIDRQILAAKARRQRANPWPTASSLV